MRRGRRLAVTGLAAALNAVLAAVARSAGVGLEVSGGETIPVSGIAFVTAVLSLAGLVIAAALLRWSRHPVQWWLRITVALTPHPFRARAYIDRPLPRSPHWGRVPTG